MQSRSIILAVGGTVAAISPATALATAPVRFASDVFVERFITAPGGRTSRILERADQLRPGDRLIFVVNWTASRSGEFTVTNPLPRAVSFQRSASGDEDVSVDGGRTWGRLDALVVWQTDGTVRAASPEDVTHIKWHVPGQRGSGQITYRGVVR